MSKIQIFQKTDIFVAKNPAVLCFGLSASLRTRLAFVRIGTIGPYVTNESKDRSSVPFDYKL